MNLDVCALTAAKGVWSGSLSSMAGASRASSPDLGERSLRMPIKLGIRWTSKILKCTDAELDILITERSEADSGSTQIRNANLEIDFLE